MILTWCLAAVCQLHTLLVLWTFLLQTHEHANAFNTRKCNNIWPNQGKSARVNPPPKKSHTHTLSSNGLRFCSFLVTLFLWLKKSNSLSWEEKRDSYWFKAFLTALTFSSSAACNSLIMKSSGLLKKRLKLRLLKKPKSFNDIFFW